MPNGSAAAEREGAANQQALCRLQHQPNMVSKRTMPHSERPLHPMAPGQKCDCWRSISSLSLELEPVPWYLVKTSSAGGAPAPLELFSHIIEPYRKVKCCGRISNPHAL